MFKIADGRIGTTNIYCRLTIEQRRNFHPKSEGYQLSSLIPFPLSPPTPSFPAFPSFPFPFTSLPAPPSLF